MPAILQPLFDALDILFYYCCLWWYGGPDLISVSNENAGVRNWRTTFYCNLTCVPHVHLATGHMIGFEFGVLAIVGLMGSLWVSGMRILGRMIMQNVWLLMSLKLVEKGRAAGQRSGAGVCKKQQNDLMMLITNKMKLLIKSREYKNRGPNFTPQH